MKQRDTKIITIKSDLGDNTTPSFLITINDIFNKKIVEDINKFIVFFFFRLYDWDDKMILNFIKDVNNIKPNSSHYVGIIYLGHKHFGSGWPIIDGQQRIITFFILLHYLNNSKNFVDNCNFDISIQINGLNYNLSKIIEKDPEFIDNLLLKEYCKNINKTLNIIKKYFSKNNISKNNFFDRFTKKVCFIMIACLDEEMELNLFFNINSKHLELDDVDKIKSYLLLKIFNDDISKKKLYTIWSSLYKRGKESAFLFFKILMNALCDTDSTGKIKYVKLVDAIENYIKQNDLSKFKLEFFNALKRFEILPSDYEKDISSCKDCNGAIKNIMASKKK